MNDFLLGVNYWASHAGADMWKDWREESVERDLELLSAYGVNTLRVFPNWRDFQPVQPLYGGGHHLREFRMSDDRVPENPYFLDETMLERFVRLCRIAEKYGLRLIVGLLTGWMSGRLYVPAAVYEKNLFTDPTALYFEQRFLKGFVEWTKGEKSIYAWDLGNECNCMDCVPSREAAFSWTEMIVNAIRACDPTRPIVSGMHSLELAGSWNLPDQGELTDILTTHPYPFWVEHCQQTPLNSFRTLLHGTAQTRYYATVGGKPCLVEELGGMGPMNCEDGIAAGFLRANLWSNWANGAPGVLWWCAFDQTHLTAPPYDWNMCERELGMIDACGRPKPVLLEMQRFAQVQKNVDLPAPKTDGVCILTWGQDHWGTAYMSDLLACQAGLNLEYAYCDQPLPDSPLYFLPSVHMDNMSKRSYDALKRKIAEGAVLYISVRDGIFTEFTGLTGFRVMTAEKSGSSGSFDWANERLPWSRPHCFHLCPERATVLAADDRGEPIFGTAQYGKGRVFFLNFPLEEMLLDMPDGFHHGYYRLYETVAEAFLSLRRENPVVGMTVHPNGERTLAVLVNFSDSQQNAELRFDCHAVYGDPARLPPFGAAIVECGEGVE